MDTDKYASVVNTTKSLPSFASFSVGNLSSDSVWTIITGYNGKHSSNGSYISTFMNFPSSSFSSWLMNKLHEIHILTINSKHVSLYIGMGTILLIMMGGYCYIFRRNSTKRTPVVHTLATIEPKNFPPNKTLRTVYTVGKNPRNDVKLDSGTPNLFTHIYSLMQNIPVPPNRIAVHPSLFHGHPTTAFFASRSLTNRHRPNVWLGNNGKLPMIDKAYKPRYLKNQLLALNTIAVVKSSSSSSPLSNDTDKPSSSQKLVANVSASSSYSIFTESVTTHEPTAGNPSNETNDTKYTNPATNVTNNSSVSDNLYVPDIFPKNGSIHARHGGERSNGSIQDDIKNTFDRIDQSIAQSLRNNHRHSTVYNVSLPSSVATVDKYSNKLLPYFVLRSNQSNLKKTIIETTIVQKIYAPVTEIKGYNPFTFSKLSRPIVANRIYSKLVPYVPVQYTTATPFRINSTVRFIGRIRKGEEMRQIEKDRFLHQYTNKYYAAWKTKSKGGGKH